MTDPLSILACIECDNEYDIQEIRYRCDCGNLLEVIHDLHSSFISADDWKTSVNRHMGETAFHRYQNILFPSLPKPRRRASFSRRQRAWKRARARLAAKTRSAR